MENTEKYIPMFNNGFQLEVIESDKNMIIGNKCFTNNIYGLIFALSRNSKHNKFDDLVDFCINYATKKVINKIKPKTN